MMAPVDALRDKESPGHTVRGFQEVSQLSRDQGALEMRRYYLSLHGAELLSRWASDAPRPAVPIERIAHISDEMRALV